MAKKDSAISSPIGAQTPPAEFVGLDAVDSPILRQGIAFWRGIRGERNFPSRTDIAPRGLGRLLRYTVLLRVIDGGADYEYRIVGDAHIVAYGFLGRGKLFSEQSGFSPGYKGVVKRLYDRVLRKKEPYAARGWVERGEMSLPTIYSETVFLPLSEDGATIDHILNFTVYGSDCVS